MVPVFSVITPSFNQGQYIAQCINSVSAQNYPQIEHIVVDGGSTDNTLTVLKQYPHLTVISEPDWGQSDALNKALRTARGDYVAFINADDYLAENILTRVASHLQSHPLVVTSFELVNGQGATIHGVRSQPRTEADLIKYWVPYSIPPQPSIFMRRALLESVRRSDGALFDPDLHYSMDYDLWLRLVQHCSFAFNIPERGFYYRMTEDNKTSSESGGMQHAEPEMARVFRRAEARRGFERRMSVVVIVTDCGATLHETVQALRQQDDGSFDIVLVSAIEGRESVRTLRKLVTQWNAESRERGRDGIVRLMHRSFSTVSAASGAGIAAARSAIVAVVADGMRPGVEFVRSVRERFRRNQLGLLLLGSAQFPAPDLAGSSSQLASKVNIDQIFSPNLIPWSFAVRTLASEDCGGIIESALLPLSMRGMILDITDKGWYVESANDISLSGENPAINRAYRSALESAQIRINAELITRHSRRREQDISWAQRRSFGYAVEFGPQLVAEAAGLSSRT